MRLLFVHLDERLFPDAGHPRHNVAPLDIASAMGCATRDGHNVHFIETHTGEVTAAELRRRLDRDPADLVIIRPTHAGLPWLDAAVDMARPRERTVLLAGASVAHAGAPLLQRTGARVLATGEWDDVPSQLAERLAQGRTFDDVPGLMLLKNDRPFTTASRPLLRDLDTLPLPRHDLLLEWKYRFHYPLKPRGPLRMGYLQTSRGCPYSCVYCSEVERASIGRPYRMHSPERVAEEMTQLARLGATSVYFVDDLFAVHKDRLLALCAAIEQARTGLSWCAQLRAGDIDDECAQALARAGCASVACGIETGSDRLLTLLKKSATVPQIQRGAAALRRAGVELVAYLIVGIPTETPEEREATLRLADTLDASLVQLHVFASYPGTEAAKTFPQFGTDGATKFTPARTREDSEDLVRVQRRFYRNFYLRPDRLARHALRRMPQLLADPSGELSVAWGLARHALLGR